MRRGLPVLLALASSGCGARTGLANELADSGAEIDIDARAEAEADVEASLAPRLCPPSPPVATPECESRGFSLLCAYLDGPSNGIEAWCCDSDGWVNCTTVANTLFTACSDLLCTPGVYVECIVGEAKECCACSADGTADECGPC